MPVHTTEHIILRLATYGLEPTQPKCKYGRDATKLGVYIELATVCRNLEQSGQSADGSVLSHGVRGVNWIYHINIHFLTSLPDSSIYILCAGDVIGDSLNRFGVIHTVANADATRLDRFVTSRRTVWTEFATTPDCRRKIWKLNMFQMFENR